jgi:hypothetical protein
VAAIAVTPKFFPRNNADGHEIPAKSGYFLLFWREYHKIQKNLLTDY